MEKIIEECLKRKCLQMSKFILDFSNMGPDLANRLTALNSSLYILSYFYENIA
jgi:hypothetical protein